MPDGVDPLPSLRPGEGTCDREDLQAGKVHLASRWNYYQTPPGVALVSQVVLQVDVWIPLY